MEVWERLRQLELLMLRQELPRPRPLPVGQETLACVGTTAWAPRSLWGSTSIMVRSQVTFPSPQAEIQLTILPSALILFSQLMVLLARKQSLLPQIRLHRLIRICFFNDAGGPIAEVCGPSDNNPNSITWLRSNAIINTNATAAPICSSNTSSLVRAGQGPINDITIRGRRPVLVEPRCSVPLFDTEYLIPAGLLSLSSYTSNPQWQGAWSASHGIYDVGDVVSFSDRTAFWGGGGLFFLQLLRQVVLNAHLTDGVQLRFEPVDVVFFVAQDLLRKFA